MKRMIVLLMLLLSVNTIASENKPSLLLAAIYREDINIKDYWVSEKLDGVRAYWNGKQLLTRQGYKINAPKWFTRVLPAASLDGELWIGRGRFDELSATVRTYHTNHVGWQTVKYMVFDLPGSPQTFDLRLTQLQKLIQSINAKHIQLIKQYRVTTHQQLTKTLNETVKAGGEGLMLHLGSTYYHGGRTNDLLKLKTYEDAEAVVIKHLPGKGKFKGMLGSILVETQNQQRFKIGSGFSDRDRKTPPPIGSTITYKYYGKTRNGIPRFASFMRQRSPVE
ncbi:MAG: DNA ligase [Gammaproteobacteria bacterium]|nr:DNA ligase [Gammaproteobacteria bacterium]